MNDREFIDCFADVAKLNRKRAAQLVRYFKGCIIAGVHSSGSVTLDGFGVFTHKWWVPVGKLAGSGMQPSNRLRFKPSKLLLTRMGKWAGAPGMSRKARNVTRAGHARPVAAPLPDLSRTQCVDAAHALGLFGEESAD